MKKARQLIRAIATAVAASSLCIVCASAALVGTGTVTDNGLRLRSEPNTSCSILATAYKNETVIVLAKANDNWYQVSRNGKLGYMSGDYLKVDSVADAALGCGEVDTDGAVLRMREAAGTNGAVIAKIPDNTVVSLSGTSNGWYKISYNGKTGYASGDYIVPVSQSGATSTESASSSTKNQQTSSSSTTVPSDASTAYNSTKGEAIVTYAKQFLGVRYVYGGESPSGFDCSGFTQYVMKQNGYSIRRTASTQYLNNGTPVSRSELQPGDLVFFRAPGSSYAATHVGIYIGDSQFIHASTTGYTVRINSLDSSWYSKIFIGGRRIAE